MAFPPSDGGARSGPNWAPGSGNAGTATASANPPARQSVLGGGGGSPAPTAQASRPPQTQPAPPVIPQAPRGTAGTQPAPGEPPAAHPTAPTVVNRVV